MAALTVKLTREPTLVPPAEETKKGIYFLSNLDCTATSVVRTIYCFSSSTKRDDDVWQVMKTSLSRVLVHYYPLAGRLTTTSAADGGRRAVDCTGQGVVFAEAEADCELDRLIADAAKPDVVNRRKLVYDDVRHVAKGPMDYPPLMAQVTKFRCGGFVLGLAFNHILADGISAVEFINSWGEIARGIPLSVPPFLDRTLLKARTPPRIEHHPSEYDTLPEKSYRVNEEVVYRYILFDEDMINKMKQEYSESTILVPNGPEGKSTNNKYCSSYEAITAFVWKARTKALKMAPDQLTRVDVVVNVRHKFEPPLPKGYFGNAIKFMDATCQARDLVDKPLPYAIGLVQEAIRRVTNEHLRSKIDYLERTRAERPVGFTFISTMWARLSFGTINFGWGEPIWTGPVELSLEEAVLLLPPLKNGKKCMYAFMGLPISAMKEFEDFVHQI